MLLSDISIRRPVMATVFSLLLIVFGIISFGRLPVREYPDIDPPIVSVETTYPGAAAAIVETRVTQTVEDPVTSTMVNDLGTLNVLEAARQNHAKRLVLASSSAVYGDDPQLPKIETMAPNPLSPYAVQKRTNEQYAQLYHRLYGLQTVCLRYFNVYGPRQDPSSPYSGVISIFMRRAAGDAGPLRDSRPDRCRVVHAEPIPVHGIRRGLGCPTVAGLRATLARCHDRARHHRAHRRAVIRRCRLVRARLRRFTSGRTMVACVPQRHLQGSSPG